MQVTPRDVGQICTKRPDISAMDASAIESSCERQYQQWLAANKGRSPRERRNGTRNNHDAGADSDNERNNMLGNMYKRVVKAVGIVEE